MTDPKFVPLEHIVASQLQDGDGVLVDLDTRQYFQLNESAMLIWRALEKGSQFREIVDEITATYAVSDEHAIASAETLLKNLQERKLVRPSA
ncbi:MAG TPA: PqqD family protein [Pyrinomonadaceae bacterium]|jgi:hypothetical protein|nr:PqqD family protein [Pyrinomonadaceae bacterium]